MLEFAAAAATSGKIADGVPNPVPAAKAKAKKVRPAWVRTLKSCGEVAALQISVQRAISPLPSFPFGRVTASALRSSLFPVPNLRLSVPVVTRPHRQPICCVGVFLALTLAFASPLSADTTATPPGSAPESQLNASEFRILARPRQSAEATDVHDARLEASERGRGLPPRRVFRHAGRIRVLTVPAGRTVGAAVAELQATGDYEFVEPDHRVYATTTPNDPRFTDGSQWDFNNTGQNSGLPGADISAPAGWSIRTSGALVAIIDSGALLTHEDLVANLWINPHIGSYGYTSDKYGIDAIANTGLNDSTATPDGNGHGTHVAGTIGAVGNNGRGVAGVAWTTQLMILRFLPASGSGSLSDSLECINYAIKAGAKIINASYGSDTPSQAELTAIRAAGAAGIIFVAAAGNDTRNLDVGRSYPAGYAADNIVAVAASTRLDELASFSDYGSGAVELAAPGQDIISTYNTSSSSYALLSGTSMAAPHVAGALSLMAAQYPSDNYRQLINRLLRSVTHKSTFAGKVHSGGRLNLANALSTASPPSPRPFNDDFADRATLVGANVLARDANQFGTREIGEPNHAGQTGGASLWWSWTAPASGQVKIDTTQSSIDTLLAVYTGSAVNALTEVRSDDNSGGNGTSQLSFSAVSGTTYQIAVDGKNGATGLVMLNVGLIPSNDSFSTPADESGPSWSVTAANASSSKESGEPNHAGQTGGHSLWYRWTAPTSRVYAVSVYTTDFDPVVAVYTGNSLSTLSTIASNNNVASGSTKSLATFTATAGQTYLIAVDGVSDTDTGQFTLSVVDSDWQYASTDIITSSPAVGTDGSVYVGTFAGQLVALSSNGSTNWTVSTGPIDMASPAIGSDGTVYCGDNKGVLWAVSAAGTVKWQYTTGAGIPSSAAISADGTTVYFRSDDHYLYALSSSGALQWRFDTGGVSYSSPSLASDGTIYVGSDNNTLYAINPNGTQKWAFTANGAVYTSPAVGSDGTVYVATLAGRLSAVAAGGTERWHFDTVGSNGITSSPVLAPNNTLYFGAYGGAVYALNTTNGAQRWSYQTGIDLRASAPVVASDGTVYIGSYDMHMYALSSGGALIRSYCVGEKIRSSPVLAGGRLYFGCNDDKLYAIPVAAGLAASDWPTFRDNPQHTGHYTAIVTAPTILVQPTSVAIGSGAKVVFSVLAANSATLSYQWQLNGSDLAGATAPTLALGSVAAGNAGTYTVIVRNSGGGSVVSSPASLTVSGAAYTPPGSVLANLSTRAQVGTGDNIMIAGFVIGGAGSKSVLLRAVGPSLASLGVPGALADPQLELTTLAGTSLALNDDWSSTDGAAISAAAGSVGAFALPSGSKDAALIVTLPAGAYTALVRGVSSATGIALVEVYDLDRGAAARLINLSARGFVGTDAQAMIAGFVVVGSAPRNVLVRANGPGLAQYVTGTIPDPKLSLTTLSGTQLASNDNWGDTNGAAIAAAAAQVGAFAWTSGSKDAAILTSLPEGQYTPKVTDGTGATGLALVELYEVP